VTDLKETAKMAIAAQQPGTRELLLSKTEEIEELVTPPESVDTTAKAERTRAKRRDAWRRKVEDAVLDLANAVGRTPEVEASYEMSQLFGLLIALRRAIDEDPKVTDEQGRVELTTMKMADVARRLERHLEHSILDYPEEAAKFVFTHLDALDATTQAKLLGVSTKTVGGWKHGKPVRQNKDRVVLVAQVLTYLRHSMTQAGVRMWFENEVDRLGGKTPLSLLETGTPAAREKLIAFARGGRGQLAG
jgi:uncharacterized protein YeeX (DUF496 family)